MSYEPPVPSRKLGFGDAKAPESNSRLQSRLSHGEKPVNGLSRSLPRFEENVQREDFKLLIDPAIKKGHAKIYRYNGVFPGQPPVVPKDPRSRRTRIWTLNKADLPVPNFKVDKWYVGIPPQREVHFSGLNDNVDKKFLQEMCERYGRIDAIKIYYDPQTKKHTGKARVTFATTTAAKMTVSKLDHTSVMGNIIKAQIDPNIKGHDIHGKLPPARRNSGHESCPTPTSHSSTHLPTPSPSMISQSSSADGSVISPSLLLMKSPASSVRLPADVWGASLSNSWDRTTAGANKLPQSGSAFMSPQSVSSAQSTFEPVSPPHVFHKNDEPPPPPPPSSNPPPPPVERSSSKEPPPPPPNEKSGTAPCIKYEDISPDPVFSPRDEDKSASTHKDKDDVKTITKLIESCRRESTHTSSPPSKTRSPRIDRSESYTKWERRKQMEREERHRDKYRDSDRHGGGNDRDHGYKDDRRFDKHGDYRHKRDDKKVDKRDNYRWDDYDRNRSGGQYRDKDDYKYRKDRDRYSTSPRRGDDRRRSDSRNRDPRLRDRDGESGDGKEVHSKRLNERDKEGHNGEDDRCRDPRLKGRNMETSDIYTRDKKVKERQNEGGSSSFSSSSKEPKMVDSENKMSDKDRENNTSESKIKDPRLQGRDNEQKSIYASAQNVSSKDTSDQEQKNNTVEDEDHESRTDLAKDESVTKSASAAEIISSVVAGASLGETKAINRYSEDAYTVGVEACSDEEPLPPGDERDVAHEVQLDITRSKIKAAQNAVKKRKLSETVQDEKQSNGSKAKKIQIVLKSVQLSAAETELDPPLNLENSLKDKEYGDEAHIGWRNVLLTADKTSPEVAADVAVSSSEAEVNSCTVKNLPLTEDISPCNSPTIEATSHVECSNSAVSKEPLSSDIYSDIEGNDDDNDVADVNNDDNDDAMSLSSISSNEDTLEVTEPDSKPLPKPKGISVPPPNVVFPPYPPPIFNPSIPPPPFFNPRVPPPPLGPVSVPPPPLPAVPPPPNICPPLAARPILPPAVPPPSGPPIPVPPPSMPHSGFYDSRRAPPFSSVSFPNSGSYGYQKVEPKKPWTAVIIDEVYRNICGDLDRVLKRDIFKKLVEASAFKALESWWDNQSKPKATALTTASSSKNLPMGQTPTSTVGLPSNSGTGASTIGPSPFERSHSTMLGLRASLPKLPSFKVKRQPEPPKTEKLDSLTRKRSNTESSDVLERETKRRNLDERDSEMETDLESSSGWDRRPRTVSRLDEVERSQSPQQLDDSMDAAPRATIVRSTEADERRPSTGSSLYHTLYSSSSSSSESGSEESESEEEEESEEGSDEESESDSEEESESESEEEETQDENKEQEELEVEMEVDQQFDKDQEMAAILVEEKQDAFHELSEELSANLLSSKENEDEASYNKNQEPEKTVEMTTAPEKANYRVEHAAPTETYRSFHIAHIVPDLFKNHDDSVDKATDVEEEKLSPENEQEVGEIYHEPVKQIKLERPDTQTIEHDSESNHRPSEEINTTIKLEESLEKTEVKIPIGAPVFAFQDKGLPDKKTFKPDNLEFSNEERSYSEMDENYKFSDERMPLLSPDKPLAVSLIELDHSYGLAVPEELAVTVEEPEVFEENNKEPPLPSDRELTESPVVDIVTVDSALTLLPVPELTPKPQFPVRSFEADDELVYEIHRLGIDAEDCYYLKVGFEQLQQVASDSVVDAHWTTHPPTAQPVTKFRRKQKTEHGVRVHVTGCARTEGYYKIDINEKAKYLQAQRRQLQCQANVTAEEQKTDVGNKAKQQSREHRAIQRRLQSVVCNEEFGDLLKFNQLMVRKKQLRFAKSGIHDWGLFAMESIAADEMVTEYVGEVIRQPIADIRERRYEEMGIGSSYLFRVDQDTIIDATTKGNLARFINHCCDPNCYAKIVTLENAKKIVIYSKRDIEVNEEITYDYKFPIEDEKIPCLCGVPQCRGTLN
ncbi:uncharacterized protein LOC144647329 isoform X3 [Oculina patagonica]